MLDPWKKDYDKPRQRIKKQRHYFANKRPSSQSSGFSSSHVWMWESEHKEGRAPKNWCFWTVVLEKILESPLDSKEIKPVHPKRNQSWIFIGRTEGPILWPSDAKSWLTGKDQGQEEKGVTGDELVDGITDSRTRVWANREIVKDMKAWPAAAHGAAKTGQTQLSN